MGTEAAWIPLVVAALGSGVSYYNTEKTASRQDAALAESINKRADASKKGTERVTQLVDQLGTDSGVSPAQRLQQLYASKLNANQGNATRSLGAPVGASERYAQDAQAAALGLQGNANNIVDLASRIDGAGLQRLEEGFASNRTVGDLKQIAAADAGAALIDDLKLRQIRRDPWLDAVAGVADGYASGAASNGSWGSAGTDTGTTTKKFKKKAG